MDTENEESISPCPFDPDYTIHPGKTVVDCIIANFGKTNGLSDKEIDYLSAVCGGYEPITEDLADFLVGILPTPKSFWMNLQKNYDDWQERHETGKKRKSP